MGTFHPEPPYHSMAQYRHFLFFKFHIQRPIFYHVAQYRLIFPNLFKLDTQHWGSPSRIPYYTMVKHRHIASNLNYMGAPYPEPLCSSMAQYRHSISKLTLRGNPYRDPLPPSMAQYGHVYSPHSPLCAPEKRLSTWSYLV